jgi:hypothetical protein
MPARNALPALLLAALATAQAPENRYRFPDFRPDFPFPLELPQRDNGPDYSRSRRQALERVVAHLKGDGRREVWLMAVEFFSRAPKDAVEPLIEAMDRASLDGTSDMVKNCVDAMGAMANDGFDEALRRALEHPNVAVRQAAYAALGPSGKAETVLQAARWVPQMDGKARAGWLRAARQRLGAKVVPIFTELMQTMPVVVRDQILTETLLLPPDQAAAVLTPMWPVAIGEFKVVIAGVRHGAGDMIGTVYLRDLMLGEDPAQIVLAVRNAARYPLGVLQEDVLRLSANRRPEVRLTVAKAIAGLDGDDVIGTLELLAQPDETWEVKAVALKALTAHHRPNAVTVLLEDVAGATGTRLQLILDMLAASGDDRAIAVFADRFAKSPPGEGRQFLQAMAFSGAHTACAALARIFLGPERPVVDPSRKGGALTTIDYVAVLMQNLRSSEGEMVAFWQQIPKDDVRRRACYLSMVANVAADRADPVARKQLEDLVRSVLFDQEANCQLRVLALNLLSRKSLTIEDAMALKQAMHGEAPPMHAVFHDFLTEFF